MVAELTLVLIGPGNWPELKRDTTYLLGAIMVTQGPLPRGSIFLRLPGKAPFCVAANNLMPMSPSWETAGMTLSLNQHHTSPARFSVGIYDCPFSRYGGKRSLPRCVGFF